jgi:hypothetical protein
MNLQLLLRVINVLPGQLPLRSAPVDDDSNIIYWVQEDSLLIPLGPADQDDYLWVYVCDRDTRREGWTTISYKDGQKWLELVAAQGTTYTNPDPIKNNIRAELRLLSEDPALTKQVLLARLQAMIQAITT